jgi:hypothetical protein
MAWLDGERLGQQPDRLERWRGLAALDQGDEGAVPAALEGEGFLREPLVLSQLPDDLTEGPFGRRG